MENTETTKPILSDKTKEIYMYALGAFIIGCCAGVIMLLFVFKVPDANHDAIMLSIGALLGWGGGVVTYFYGSSKSSSDKTDIIRQQVSK